MKMTIFLFSEFLHFPFLFWQISLSSAKSCVVLLQKGQLFVFENHDIFKNKLRYKNTSYKKGS